MARRALIPYKRPRRSVLPTTPLFKRQMRRRIVQKILAAQAQFARALQAAQAAMDEATQKLAAQAVEINAAQAPPKEIGPTVH